MATLQQRLNLLIGFSCLALAAWFLSLSQMESPPLARVQHGGSVSTPADLALANRPALEQESMYDSSAYLRDPSDEDTADCDDDLSKENIDERRHVKHRHAYCLVVPNDICLLATDVPYHPSIVLGSPLCTIFFPHEHSSAAFDPPPRSIS